jgi:opacity protein-like surface antigen
MRTNWIRTISLCILLLSAHLFAQSQLRDTTSPGTAPAFELSAGYLYMNVTTANSSRLTLRGIDASGVMQFTPRWGAMLDLSYARDGNVFATRHSEQFGSALIGPQFYVIDRYAANVFVHGLVGSALVDSALPTSSGTVIKGYVARFSYAVGGGAEFTLHGPVAFRLSGDYQRTTFVNSALAPALRSNIRATTSLVYRFGSR